MTSPLLDVAIYPRNFAQRDTIYRPSRMSPFLWHPEKLWDLGEKVDVENRQLARW